MKDLVGVEGENLECFLKPLVFRGREILQRNWRDMW